MQVGHKLGFQFCYLHGSPLIPFSLFFMFFMFFMFCMFSLLPLVPARSGSRASARELNRKVHPRPGLRRARPQESPQTESAVIVRMILRRRTTCAAMAPVSYTHLRAHETKAN